MSGQIHADFLRLLWILADKQLWSYYESMCKEDKIGNESDSVLSKTAIFPKKEGRKREISNESARGSSLREANV